MMDNNTYVKRHDIMDKIKQVQINLLESEIDALKKIKGNKTWREFLISLIDDKEDKK